jgi:NADH-quinone oxidoreductase subunit N
LGGLAGPAGWLTVLAILLSAVALYYYLQVLKQAMVVAPSANNSGPVYVPLVTRITLLVAAAMLVGLGLFPTYLLRLF